MKKVRILIKIIRSVYSNEYNKKRPINAFYRSSKWYIKSFLKADSFYDTFWNYKMKFWLDSNQSLWLYRNYIMDWNEFNFIQKFVKPDDIIFDVGTNIGVYSLWFSKCLGSSGKIYSFEPNATNINRCKEIIELNNIKNIIINPFAVSDKDGKLYFTKNRDNENQIINHESEEDKTEVVSVTLDNFCKQRNIDKINYLKMDIEGAEYLALKGSEYLLNNNKIDVIQFEVNNKIKEFGIDPVDVVNFLKKFNYELYEFNLLTNSLKKLKVAAIDFNVHSNYYALNNNNYKEVLKRIGEIN